MNLFRVSVTLFSALLMCSTSMGNPLIDATPVPVYTVYANSTCDFNVEGVYNFDSMAVQCQDVAICRSNLCGCLGVEDYFRCWMRSDVSCSQYMGCLATAVYCVNLAALLGTSASCGSFRDAYMAAAPPLISTAASLTGLLDYEVSPLRQQCSAFICNAERYYFPDTGCPVNESIACASPDAALTVIDILGDAPLDQLATEQNLLVGLAQSISEVASVSLGFSVAAVVISVSTPTPRLLEVVARLDNSDVLSDNFTSFLRSPENSTLAALPSLNIFLASIAYNGTVILEQVALVDTSSGAAGGAIQCDDLCVFLVVALGISVLIFLLALLALFYVRCRTVENNVSPAVLVRRADKLQRAKLERDHAEREPFHSTVIP